MSRNTLSLKKIKASKAKAVKVKEEEYQEINRLKEREALQRQKEYRKVFLTRLYQQQVLEEIQIQITAEKNFIKDNPESTKTCIKIQWMGMTMPIKLLKNEFDLQLDNYRDIVSKEKYLKEALVNDGLSDEELLSILGGDIIKSKNKKDVKNKKGEPKIDYVG